MKNFLLIAVLLLSLSSCGHKKNDSVNTVKFPPPVVMADDEVAENPPTVKELEVADPGVKSQKGDPSADIVLNGPVGNADKMVDATQGFSKKYMPASSTKTVNDTSKKITKEGDISFETKDIAATRKGLLNNLRKLGGYLDEDNESVNSDDDRKEYTLKARIPSKNFDLFLDSVSTTAIKIDSKHITITDVTTRYIDMSTRLQNKKLLEASYLALLKKATKMSDILDVENKLNDIRTEIESTQGQLNYLNKQIAYSSLDITFYVTHLNKPYVASNTFGHQFQKALTKGFNYVKKVFFGIIALWPLWVLVIAAFLVIRSRIKRKKAMTEDQPKASV
ncbi:MAG: DUF4349 domain-containing protein [Sphingobacteriales bacterium]